MEGLTEATAQEREDAAAARGRNDQLQAAINTLQLQMAETIGGNEANALQVPQQQNPPMQMQPQQMWHQPPMNMGRGMQIQQGAKMQQWHAPPPPEQWGSHRDWLTT